MLEGAGRERNEEYREQAMKEKTPLQNSVRRILLFRLCLIVIVLAIIFALLSYYHSREMLTRSVIQATTNRISVIQGRFREIMQVPGADISTALQDAIRYPPGSDIQIKEGSFIYARLHTANREKIGVFEHNTFPALKKVKEYLSESRTQEPEFGKLDYKAVTIGSSPYIDIHVQLIKGDSDSAIFLRAIFALSKEAVHAIHIQAIKIIFYVIGIVLLTALLIYPVIAHLMNKLANFSTGLLNAQLETMEALGTAIAKRDSDTNSHNYRVTLYAVAMGERLGLNELQMQCLIKGAFLHDVGKIGIRDTILLSKGHLNAQEFATMQKHVEYGIEIISQSNWLLDARDIVGGHHEKYDGSGYPNGLRGNNIPLNARIFALVDVFDALTSERPYKKPYSFKQTIALMEEERGSHFDPTLLDTFKELAKALYTKYAGCEDNRLQQRLHQITTRYFHSGIKTLKY